MTPLEITFGLRPSFGFIRCIIRQSISLSWPLYMRPRYTKPPYDLDKKNTNNLASSSKMTFLGAIHFDCLFICYFENIFHKSIPDSIISVLRSRDTRYSYTSLKWLKWNIIVSFFETTCDWKDITGLRIFRRFLNPRSERLLNQICLKKVP